MHYLLFYHAVNGYAERRIPYREAHLAYARSAQERGHLILAGALADPIDQAILLFNCDEPAIIEEFARNDPYVINGLVTKWEIRRWTTVVGQID